MSIGEKSIKYSMQGVEARNLLLLYNDGLTFLIQS